VPGGARNVEWVGSPTLWVGLLFGEDTKNQASGVDAPTRSKVTLKPMSAVVMLAFLT
jgi:hypothetical protein